MTGRFWQDELCHDLTTRELLPAEARSRNAEAAEPGGKRLRGKPGRPKRRPETLLGDRGYHVNRVLAEVEERGIETQIARLQAGHGSGLGRQRWVVERTISWLHQHRRLRLRYERRADIHEAFLSIACSLICHRALQGAF